MTEANFQILKGANEFEVRWTVALRNWRDHAGAVIVRLKALAPYALIELVLPGGSVMALLLWLYRRRKNRVAFGGFPVGVAVFALLVWRSRGRKNTVAFGGFPVGLWESLRQADPLNRRCVPLGVRSARS